MNKRLTIRYRVNTTYTERLHLAICVKEKQKIIEITIYKNIDSFVDQNFDFSTMYEYCYCRCCCFFGHQKTGIVRSG